MDIVRFTLEDIEDLLWSWSEKEGIAFSEDCPIFRKSWDSIVSSLLGQFFYINTLHEVQNLCYRTFSLVAEQINSARLEQPTEDAPLQETLVFHCRAQTEFVDEEEMNAGLEPSDQSTEEPTRTEVPLSHPIAPPSLAASHPSDRLQEGHQEPKSLESLVSSLPPGLNLIKQPMCSVLDSDEEDMKVLSPPFAEGADKVAWNCQVENGPEGFKVSIVKSVNGFNTQVTHSELVIGSKVTEDRGEDHNHFVDRSDQLSRNFNTESDNLAARSTQDQDLALPFESSFGEEEELPVFNFEDSAFHFKSGQALSFQDRLRDENKLPMFCFEEEDTSFSDAFYVFDLNNDPDLSSQESLQDSLRDEDKLRSIQLKKALAKEGTDLDDAPSGQLGMKVSSPNCVPPLLDAINFVKTLSSATCVSKTLSSSSSVYSASPDQLPIPALNEKEDSVFELERKGVAEEKEITLFGKICLPQDPAELQVAVLFGPIEFNQTSSILANEITEDLCSSLGNQHSLLSSLSSTQYSSSTEQFKVIQGVKNILPRSNHISSRCSPNCRHISVSQNSPCNSLAPVSSYHIFLHTSIDEAHCGLAWNRSGIGPDHVFPSEDHLRNEDKLPSFHLNSKGSISGGGTFDQK
ncbi:hypothetical protein Pst134EB_021840 [Puccinia striiformis f. sp. tritici]|nr:hypothetical protein Pst134EB_021840 [Puccinia striiformis f. sp. tritici]